MLWRTSVAVVRAQAVEGYVVGIPDKGQDS